MQSGGGTQQGLGASAGGHGRNPALGPSSSSASPSSSSSPVSTPRLGFDSNRQQQQLGSRQVLQQQLRRKPEGNESLLAYQSNSIHGVTGGGNLASVSNSMQLPQPSRNFMDLAQQHIPSHGREEAQAQNKGQGIDQKPVLNPVHQAYLQYTFQAAQQKSALGMQPQPQPKMGLVPPPTGKEQDPQRSDLKPTTQPIAVGQLLPPNMNRPPPQQNTQNMGSNQLSMAAQFQAVQAWALERNIDLTQPGNANLMAQLIPLIQSRMMTQQKSNESNAVSSKQQITSAPIGNENSPRGNSSTDVKSSNNIQMQQFGSQGREHQMSQRNSVIMGNSMPPMHPPASSPSSSVNVNQSVDLSLRGNNMLNGQENLQMQYLRQVNRSSPQPTVPSNDTKYLPQSGGVTQLPHQHVGFTKQQLHVLKAQILAFRRLKKGEGTLPQELLKAIAAPPFELQLQQSHPSPGSSSQDRPSIKNIEDHPRHLEPNEKDQQSAPLTTNPPNTSKEEIPLVEDKAKAVMREPLPIVVPKEEQQNAFLPLQAEQEVDRVTQRNPVPRSDLTVDRGKAVPQQVAISDSSQVKKPVIQASTVQNQPKDVIPSRKYHGPLFDFPFFTRKHDSFGSAMMGTNNNNLALAYDVKEILFEEGLEVINKKRMENLKKIGGLLAVNLERKRIRPDLVLRLQIEERKLRLVDLQARLREEVDQEQQEIMSMPDRPYRKFVRLCERQRMELARHVQALQRASREKQLKSIFQWRKKLLEAHWAIRDARTARNRGVAKYHERTLREFSKRKDDDRNKRMEALKNNDVERYREMLLEQQTSIPGEAAERYAVLSSFLTQTEEYLHKLGSKITAAKNQQEVEEAANAAAAAARLQGLSEEEVRAAAACAGEEVMIRNRFSEMNAPKENSSVNKYYNLAHAVNERVVRQPSMLRRGTLRDYQLVGLQWMLSLYNNKLNGILADEMGLGKTVQVMALIAYLMEFKGNYGPHLIIVPNAVLVNWKSEFHNWLPTVSCIFYVGGKEQRSKLFSQEVCAMKFNVLVTTYEFIMYDRSKLSKVDWKYIIIDEAQRMKDRESVLARDLDRYRCQRRLLLTGTPLQNDLKELWSLLNLLLPEVFDNRKAFHDWFSKPFQKEGPTHNAEDDWLETEKKVIIIHRLHQILEPFMLRRRVEDVEGSLPPKVSIVLRCRMSAIQSAIYDWIKSTGTLRVDPEDEMRRVKKNPNYKANVYRPLNNRCMELRKVCNHPLLNYPYFNDFSKDFLVRSCGKLWILDRILIKLQRTEHRVLLFSTMTKLLDILEEYLQWRRLVYRRIDGTTSLEDRESAIVDFNSPDSDCFIFLLSIRAAGRGLNLQSADTVVIYDPDPNPKNEEQAVARAHRIGQTREVKVIYMEAVVDKISSNEKEDELRSGDAVDLEDELAGKDRYMGSVESLIRNNIQQYKIDMADEVINAGRFDQRTTHEERRLTLETLLHDEERYQETVHDVPSLQEVNRMIARSEEEVELFDQMDEELDWTEEMRNYDQVPEWLRASTREVNATIAHLSKKPSKTFLSTSNIVTETGSDLSPKTERRGRPKGKKVYTELDDEIGEFSEADSEERNNGYSNQEEEGEIGEFEEQEEFDGAGGVPLINKDQSEEDIPVCHGGYDYSQNARHDNNTSNLNEEVGSSGSSSGSQRLTIQRVSPSISSQKFGSLSALDARPSSLSKRLPDELEEGEIAMSGDSHMDHQQSGSWIHDRDEGEDEQVVQPKIKRKRSIRFRPHRLTVENSKEKSSNEKHRRESSQFPFQVDHNRYEAQLRIDHEPKRLVEPSVKRLVEPSAFKHDNTDLGLNNRRDSPSRKMASMPSKLTRSASRLNSVSAPTEDSTELSRDSWDCKATNSSGMSDIIQRRCKNVLFKLQRKIDKEGPQIVPLLTDLWKRSENTGYNSGAGNDNLLDLRKIDQRVERFDYNGVIDFLSDVQFMLKSAVQYFGFSHEVRSEARKVHDLFFDIMKIAFPDTDFREARNSLSFLGSASNSTAAPAARQVVVSQNRRHKLINEMEPDPIPSPKPNPNRPSPIGEDIRTRTHIAQKESRLGSSGSSQQEDAPVLTHPGELVICKKRRKDRDKSVVKIRAGPGGPVSPPSIGRGIRSPGLGLSPRETRSVQQQGWAHQQPAQPVNNNGGGAVGWANPVKRLRTDAGRRRPSQT